MPQSSPATPSAGANKVQVYNACVYRSFNRVENLPVTFNVESPAGPTTHGDPTMVTVQMLQTENPGIGRQIGSPLVDGTVGVTQRPILTFTDDRDAGERRLATLINHVHCWWGMHVPEVVPMTPRPRRELLVGPNTQGQNRTNHDTIINIGSPAMDPQAPPSVSNAPAVSAGGDEADAEAKRVFKMVIPVCGLTVAAALALIVAITFDKPSDAAASTPLYSVAMTFVSLGLLISVALLVYSIVAERSRRPWVTRMLKAAMAMSVIFVCGPFATCAVMEFLRREAISKTR